MKERSTIENRKHLILFLIVFVLFMAWIIPQGAMNIDSGDAADIWHTIKSYYSDDIYPSYVLYKGFMSVYPYVWFYQLSMLLHTNEFLFVMVYHAVLFSYVAVLGVPNLIEHFLKHKAALYQRTLLVIVLFSLWRGTMALNNIMVDLPSCAVFILAANLAIRIKTESPKRKYIVVIFCGLLCGLNANISGQYGVAMDLVMIYAVLALSPIASLKNPEKRWTFAACILLLIGMYTVPYLINDVFYVCVIQPFKDRGINIVSAEVWLHRGLIYMIRNYRLFYGFELHAGRGASILESLYGVEGAQELWSLAAQGGYGWTVREWFSVFVHYPVDLLVIMLDKAFICISFDLERNSLMGLIFSYVSLYIALYQLTRVKKVKDILSADLWLIAAWISTIAPLLVLAVEMRCAMSLHALVFGMALLSPTLPELWQSISKGVHECICQKSFACLKAKSFPWAFVFCILFIVCCISHMGSLYAQSELGTGALFRWF